MQGQSTRRWFLGAMAAAPAFAAGFWEKKPYADWSEGEILRMLTDSPWARSSSISLKLEKSDSGDRWANIPMPGTTPGTPGAPPDYGVGSPVGGIGAPMPKTPGDADISILWTSATPIKQAIAISKLGKEAARSEEARGIIEKEDSDYVVEVFGIPAIAAHAGAQMIQTEIYRTAYLRTRSGHIIRAGSVYTPIQGGKLVITMRFPRDKPITLKDRWVECGADAEVFKFEQRFELSQMVIRGKLEL